MVWLVVRLDQGGKGWKHLIVPSTALMCIGTKRWMLLEARHDLAKSIGGAPCVFAVVCRDLTEQTGGRFGGSAMTIMLT
jgi:hypothetical protein